MISGISGNCYMICFQEQKNGAPMQVQGTGRMPICFRPGPIRQVYDVNNWTNFTQDEQITMLTLWSIMRSPLMLGGELTGFDEFTMNLVTNSEILAMHANARHSHQVWRREIDGIEHALWIAADTKSGYYVAVFNLGDKDSDISIPLADLEIYDGVNGTELWSGEYVEEPKSLSVSLKSHGARAYHFTYNEKAYYC